MEGMQTTADLRALPRDINAKANLTWAHCPGGSRVTTSDAGNARCGGGDPRDGWVGCGGAIFQSAERVGS